MASNGRHARVGGPVQSALPGFDADPEQTDSLFFGLFLPAPVAPQVEQIAQRLRAEHKFSGGLLLTERFHLSLYDLGDFVGLPPHIVTMALQAGAETAAAMPPFEITLNRAMSFGKPGNHAYVLAGGDGVAPVVHFRQALRVAMAKAGLKVSNAQSFSPHMTLLYDAKSVDEHAVEPVNWTATELVLVHSLRRQTKYVPLGRWTLRGG